MSEKYLKTKEGSIESAVVKSVHTPKEEPKKENKEYKTSSYFGTKEGSIGDAFNKVMNEGGPGSGPQVGDKRGTYKTGHKKSVMKPGAGKRPGSAPDGGQTDKEADDYDTEIGEDLTAGQKKLPPALQKVILKKMKKEDLDSKDNPTVKDVIGQLKKATKAHAGQAKDLEKAMDEKLVGGQKKLDKDKDGDLDAKDFAMLRKSKKEDVSDMNKKKHAAYKDPKRGEHDVVDPKPKLKVEDTIKNIWQKAGDELEETKKNAQYMKTPPAKTDASTDTESEQDGDQVKKLKIKLDKEKDTDALEKQNITLQGQVELLKQKLENEKNKAIKPEPNPDTGEIPLTVGVAYKALRDKMKKEGKMNEARWEVEGRISYRGISSEDDFHMVIDAPSEKAAEAKVEKELEKARDRRKIGPGGGGNIEDFDIEHLERTTDRLSAPQTTYRNSYDPTQKEDKQPDIVDDKETKKEKSKGKALTGSPKTVVDTDPKVDYKN